MGIGLLAVLGQGLIERGLFTAVDAGDRGVIYANALARIAERPILGYGLDSFAVAYELGASGASISPLVPIDAHSTYLENWVEGGVIFGSAMILAGLMYILRLRAIAGGLLGGGGVPAGDDPKSGDAKAGDAKAGDAKAGDAEASLRPPLLTAAALGVLALAGGHALVDFSFEIEANVMILAMLLALGVTPLRRRVRQT
jgi:O-antigen ligase